MTTGADVVLLAPDRTEATFLALARCREAARASPTRLGRCFVSTHVHIDDQPRLAQTAVQTSMLFVCEHDTETSTAF